MKSCKVLYLFNFSPFHLSPITNNLYLFDKETGVYTPLADGAQYTYTVTGNTDRLLIVRKNSAEETQRPAATKYIRDAHLYIRIDGTLYDAQGRKIGESK